MVGWYVIKVLAFVRSLQYMYTAIVEYLLAVTDVVCTPIRSLSRV